MPSAAGGSTPGTWQVTWQYLACLLRSGELYEQLGAWEDALLAFKEGLLLVRPIPWHIPAQPILVANLHGFGLENQPLLGPGSRPALRPGYTGGPCAL